jgi:AcrR family transcriptional regulator
VAQAAESSVEREPTRRRLRLSPEVRRRQLLDVAASLVATEGQAALTMERLASTAGVSNGAVYRYFGNRAEVFLALLEEQWARLDTELAAAQVRATSFEELLVSTVELYLRAVPQRGEAFRRLNYETSVERLVEERRLQRRADFLDQVSALYQSEFGLASPTADAAAAMTLASLETGAKLVADSRAAPSVVVEVQLALVTAGLSRLAAAERVGGGITTGS